jgi:flagellar motor switch protein FliG
MAALTQTDREIVTLALAGASEELMNRILRRLPRRQAKEFRKRLRDIGPTRLSDMLAAQQQLAQNARQSN